MNSVERLARDLPDPDTASRFFSQLRERYPSDANRLVKDEGLLSDLLTLVSYSPLAGATALQNPEYLWWLGRERSIPGVRSKDDLLESLARFSLTHSTLEPNVMLARFRRRELMRIYLNDIRRLATIAEITEELSNLADAVLEYATRIAIQDLENRFGAPLTIDENGRRSSARFCIVSLGKLGSKELNYSSDIDLLFLYSSEGQTAAGKAGRSIENKEFFIKLSESVIRLIAHQVGEGAAYRVDTRLRPHGRVGPLAISFRDAVRYYAVHARPWERQVLIRSRASAGDPELFRTFFSEVEGFVFSPNLTVEESLTNVRHSKQKIDLEQTGRGIDVKLGKGGIREIEFIAQALQLAYGGRDPWLRNSHTLISLSRLAERGYISDVELTELYDAYRFLRRTEHVLQMENGLQTHLVPKDPKRRTLLARRMQFDMLEIFDAELSRHRENVGKVFVRVFRLRPVTSTVSVGPDQDSANLADARPSDKIIFDVAPRFTALLTAHSDAGNSYASPFEAATREHYANELLAAVTNQADFRGRLASLRRKWSQFLAEIVYLELCDRLEINQSKAAQTALAEASIDAALEVAKQEVGLKFSALLDRLAVSVLGLGKLGSGRLDYDSDLDLVLVYDDAAMVPANVAPAEFYGRAAEVFVMCLSSVSREGSLYRVDLRLRPYGNDGPAINSASTLVNYMRESSAVWEWLAYVKLRAVGGWHTDGRAIEREIRETIHTRAASFGAAELAAETRRIRLELEKSRATGRSKKLLDIKYGAGGMLDIYFAIRFLQLRYDVRDEVGGSSTPRSLDDLYKCGSISTEDFTNFSRGYEFLATLDHNLRLIAGTSSLVPVANPKLLGRISERMGFQSASALIEELSVHRLNIRESFESITGV